MGINLNTKTLWMAATSCLLVSCSTSSHWAVDHIHSDQTEYTFTKIFCPAPDPVHGIDVEFVFKNPSEIQAYLIVHSQPVAPLKNDPQAVSVSIRSAPEKFSCTATAFKEDRNFFFPLR